MYINNMHACLCMRMFVKRLHFLNTLCQHDKKPVFVKKSMTADGNFLISLITSASNKLKMKIHKNQHMLVCFFLFVLANCEINKKVFHLEQISINILNFCSEIITFHPVTHIYSNKFYMIKLTITYPRSFTQHDQDEIKTSFAFT